MYKIVKLRICDKIYTLFIKNYLYLSLIIIVLIELCNLFSLENLTKMCICRKTSGINPNLSVILNKHIFHIAQLFVYFESKYFV